MATMPPTNRPIARNARMSAAVPLEEKGEPPWPEEEGTDIELDGELVVADVVTDDEEGLADGPTAIAQLSGQARRDSGWHDMSSRSGSCRMPILLWQVLLNVSSLRCAHPQLSSARLDDAVLLHSFHQSLLSFILTMAALTVFLLLGMLTARGHGQTYSATYLPSNAPDHTQTGQYGTNQCGTQSSQDSLCQNAYRELQRLRLQQPD